MTLPQLWALYMIEKHTVTSAAQLGELMMRRPGIEDSQEHPGKTHYKAQALGRLGGTMAHRLKRRGEITWESKFRHGLWWNGPYKLTTEGRVTLLRHGNPPEWADLI